MSKQAVGRENEFLMRNSIEGSIQNKFPMRPIKKVSMEETIVNYSSSTKTSNFKKQSCRVLRIKKSSFTNYESIPKEFQTEELMRASWSSELDVEKQRAIYEDLQQKSKKSTKR